MENLKKALNKILTTVEVVASAYEDKKINWAEWVKIGGSAIMWTWIFKNIPAIKEDLANATESGINEMMEQVKADFDIPQDKLEDTIEQALSVLLLFLTMMDGLKKDDNPA